MTNSAVSSSLRRALWAEMSRRDPSDPWAWAMTHRAVAGRPLQHLPALAAIARDPSPLVVIQKSAQVGATELSVNQALWAADSGYAGRGHVLFLMPTQNQMDDFAQARFDRALQDSPYLRARLQPEPPRRKGADSKRLKRIGPGYLFLRGADSRRQIASVDADLVVLDEFDQMAEGTFELAQKRLASSQAGRLIVASTPRFPEAGVNALYLQSDQRRYHLPCPACRLMQPLTWDDNVDCARARVVCRACAAAMDVRLEGEWRAEAPGNTDIRGYHLSRLYSPWANLAAMVRASAADTPAALQEFHNSDLGEVFAPPGGGLSLELLDRCRRDYGLDAYAGQPCDRGVDVGLKLHVVIREHVHETVHDRDGFYHKRSARLPRLWFAETVASFDELDALMERFHVKKAVIDALPETQLAAAFARRHERGARERCACQRGAGSDARWRAARLHSTYRLYRTEATSVARPQPPGARDGHRKMRPGFSRRLPKGDVMVQTAATLRRGFVLSPHGNIEYFEVGSGEPLIMLHPTPSSSMAFREVAPPLAEDARVIAMSTMGFGHSDRPSDPYTTLHQFAQAVVWLMDGLGLGRAHPKFLSTIRRSRGVRLPNREPELWASEIRAFLREPGV